LQEGLLQLKSCASGVTLVIAVAADTPAALGTRDAFETLRELGEGLLGCGEVSGLESSADRLEVLAQLTKRAGACDA
jgi:hypothetical protein